MPAIAIIITMAAYRLLYLVITGGAGTYATIQMLRYGVKDPCRLSFTERTAQPHLWIRGPYVAKNYITPIYAAFQLAMPLLA